MKDKLKALFDNRATWAAIGAVAGAFGEKALMITNALGALIMAVI